MIQMKLTSLKFISELQARARSFANQNVSATLMVPSDLAWWYWLEFGTAGRQSPDAPYRSSYGGTYPIDPVNADALSFPPSPGAEHVIRAHVDHPGIRPRAFVRTAIGELSKKGLNVTQDMLDLGFRLSVLKQSIFNALDYDAKEQVAKELEAAAPNTREDGKLDGNSAAEVFLEEAYVLDTSGGRVTGSSGGTSPSSSASSKTSYRKGPLSRQFEHEFGSFLAGKTFRLFGKTVKASPYNHEHMRPFLKTDEQIKAYYAARSSALAEQKRLALRHYFSRVRNTKK